MGIVKPMGRISGARSRMTGNQIQFEIGIDEVLSSIGVVKSLTLETMQDSVYLDAVVDTAFKVADTEFNLEAEAYAKSSGNLSHMYEWGTIGINKGQTNARLPASNPNARLWTNFTKGTGLDRELFVAFRPSVAMVPKPTQGNSGMSQDIINKLKPHVFTWKAQVIELAEEVHIKRTGKTKFLLIPAYEQNRPYMRASDVKRGYMIDAGPINANPGIYSNSGKFTEFWFGYWMERGNEVLENTVSTMIIEDYRPMIEKRRTKRTLRPVQTINVKASVAEARKKASEYVTRKAKAREGSS